MSIDLLAWRHSPDQDRLSIEQTLSRACGAKDPQLSLLAVQAVTPVTCRLRASTTVLGALERSDADASSALLSADLLNAAAAVELVHIGAVTHDDVIDSVTTRSESPTVNATAGNLQAILAGDFLMARASEYAAAHGTQIAQMLAETIGWICEGRARQLQQSGSARPTPEERIDTISTRHASLFSTGATIGALVAGASSDSADAVGQAGMALGRSIAIFYDVARIVSGDPWTGTGPLADLDRHVWTLPMTIAGPGLMDRAQSGANPQELRDELMAEPRASAISMGRSELDAARTGLEPGSPLHSACGIVAQAFDQLARA